MGCTNSKTESPNRDLDLNSCHGPLGSQHYLFMKTDDKNPQLPEIIVTEADNFKDFELHCQRAHNSFRSKHGGPDMTLNRNLCDMAQKYAEHLLQKSLLEHSNATEREYRGEYVGENLGCYTGPEYSSYDATENWYNEINEYNFNNPGFQKMTGHFTQVVWRSSTQLGVGKAVDPALMKTVMVTRYFPGGNVAGCFPQNVAHPR